MALALGGCAAGAAGPAGAGSASGFDEAYPPPARPLRAHTAPPVVTEGDLDRADEPRRVAELLGLTPGQRIVQLEAGTGYYALRFARALGPATTVLAVDSDPAAVALIEGRALDLGVPWVHAALSTDDDPRLAPASADVAIVADAYATIREPYAYFARVAAAIPGGGRLAVVAFDADIQLGGMPVALVTCELQALGYRLERAQRLVPVDRYVAVFTPPERVARPAEVRPCSSDGSGEPSPR